MKGMGTLRFGMKAEAADAFEIAILFPADGDSALVSLSYDEVEWAYLELRGIDLAAEGEARVVHARVAVELFPMAQRAPRARLWRRSRKQRDTETSSHESPPESLECAFEEVEARLEGTPAWWSFKPADAIPHLERAKELLLENERGRIPLEDEEGLTLAGAAVSKMSPENLAAMLAEEPEHVTEEEAHRPGEH
jgi:hypothetical protein